MALQGRGFDQLRFQVATLQVAFLSLLVVGLNGYWALAQVRLEPLALVGNPAPGTEAIYENHLGWRHASSDGRFTWQARLSTGHQGLWVNDDSGTRLVARTGEGSAYAGFLEQASGFINSSGEVTLVTTRSSRHQEIIVVGNEPDRVVLRTGQAAPGLPELTVEPDFFGVLIHDSGIVDIRRHLSGPGVTDTNNVATWVGPPDNLQVFLRAGDPAPGFPGKVFGPGYWSRFNDSGFGVVVGDHSGGDKAIWAGTVGDIQLVAAENEPAAGAEGFRYGSMVNRTPDVAADNSIAFAADLFDASTDQAAGDGLWFGSRENLRLILGPNSPSPIGDHSSITSIFHPRINDDHIAVWVAKLDDGMSDQIVLLKTNLHEPEVSEVIASTGDVAPGGTAEFTSLRWPLINRRGDVIFSGTLAGFGGANIGHGYWIKPVDQPLQLIAREQQSIDILPGPAEEWRTIRLVGLRSSFTDQGSVAFGLAFDDNSNGIFAARLVPEPSSLPMAVVGVILAICRRGRRRPKPAG